MSELYDSKLFKVYKDSDTRILHVGDVIIYTMSTSNSITDNKPYVVREVGVENRSIVLLDNTNNVRRLYKGAGFKVVATQPIEQATAGDICIAFNNKTYIADDTTWLDWNKQPRLADKVLVLSTKYAKVRRFKNSKITTLKETPSGYDII